MIRPRKKRPKMGVRIPTHIRCRGHLVWVKSRACLIEGKYSTASAGAYKHECSDTMDPHHVHFETDGGTGIKPSDCWTIPLCRKAHDLVHFHGEDAFARMWRIGSGDASALKTLAEQAWALSPAGKRWRMANEKAGGAN